MSKILYQIKRRVWLTQINNGVANVNMPYGGFNADFLVYKNLDNDLEFYIKNLDRKPIPLQAKRLKVSIITYDTNELVLQRDATVVDVYKGLIKLHLYPEDTTLWPSIYYRYFVSIINEDGTENPLFVDQSRNACGYLELVESHLPKPTPIVEILPSDFVPIDEILTEPTCYLSQSYPGPSNYSFSDRNITIQLYMTNFSGSVKVQASLDEVPEQDSDNWFDIELNNNETEIEYADCSGNIAYSVKGNYAWLRVRYCPTIDNTGTIDKVIIKI